MAFKFQYQPRAVDLVELYKDKNLDVGELARLLEQRDRDLEDYLNSLHTGPSAGVVAEFGGDVSDFTVAVNSNTSVNLGSYTAPSSGASRFYVHLFVHSPIYSTSLGPQFINANFIPYFSNIAGPVVKHIFSVNDTIADFAHPSGGAAWIVANIAPGDTASLDCQFGNGNSSAGGASFSPTWWCQVTGI